MNEIGIFEQNHINILSYFGVEHPLFYVNGVTLFNTWIVIAMITAISFIGRYFLTKKGVTQFIILNAVESFCKLVEETLGFFEYKHFAFITSIFTFILLCNCISIIPWTTEPTQDINTALALGLISFFYKEFYNIYTNGFRAYVHEFLEPFFIMLPVNIIGHFSKIVSISFRLFGNIFGGSIIMELYKGLINYSVILQLAGLFSGFNFIILLFFGVFEGVIQAFVFSMLTLTYLSLVLQKEPAEES